MSWIINTNLTVNNNTTSIAYLGTLGFVCPDADLHMGGFYAFTLGKDYAEKEPAIVGRLRC